MRRALAALLAALIAGTAGWFARELNAHPRLQDFVDKEALIIRKLGFSCGVERWSVKTLADSRASQIHFAPTVWTNIAKLDAIPSNHPSAREAPVETSVYGLSATHVVAFKLEPDSDIHLKLRSPLPGNPTMIAELPDQSCISASADPTARAEQLRIGTARAAFLRYALSKGHSLTGSYQNVDWTAAIQGVGFFDFDHGQNGVAPNAIELHPVLSFFGRS